LSLLSFDFTAGRLSSRKKNKLSFLAAQKGFSCSADMEWSVRRTIKSDAAETLRAEAVDLAQAASEARHPVSIAFSANSPERKVP
jgi:hypothetical protein